MDYFAFDGDAAVLGAVNPASIAFSLTAPSPEVYCTAKTNSLGCVPRISFLGSASASSLTAFDITAQSVLSGKFGLLFYGVTGATSFPFQGGTLCVLPPTRRTVTQASGGIGGTCTGSYSFDFNALVRSGAQPDLGAGVMVNAQYWYRDPASPSTTGLTDALEFGIGF